MEHLNQAIANRFRINQCKCEDGIKNSVYSKPWFKVVSMVASKISNTVGSRVGSRVGNNINFNIK